MERWTIIGVGSRIRGDDAVGPLIIDQLHHLDLDNVRLIDAGSDTLGVLEFVDVQIPAIIIDACRMGSTPGTCKVFSLGDVDLVLKKDQITLHGLGLAEALKMGTTLKMLPDNLKIIGIEPVSTQLNGELSAPVEQAMKIAMDEILRIVKHECDSVEAQI